jgi:hypothetical protein
LDFQLALFAILMVKNNQLNCHWHLSISIS